MYMIKHYKTLMRYIQNQYIYTNLIGRNTTDIFYQLNQWQ